MVHTSPLDQAGTGDAGGMNIYVVEAEQNMAAMGVEVDILGDKNESETEIVRATIEKIVDYCSREDWNFTYYHEDGEGTVEMNLFDGTLKFKTDGTFDYLE